jgi:hypothetical protein
MALANPACPVPGPATAGPLNAIAAATTRLETNLRIDWTPLNSPTAAYVHQLRWACQHILSSRLRHDSSMNKRSF